MGGEKIGIFLKKHTETCSFKVVRCVVVSNVYEEGGEVQGFCKVMTDGR